MSLVLLLGGTYAFIELTLTGEKKQAIVAGTLSLELLEDDNNISITDALPMYDEVGMIQEPFTFRLVNNGTSSANYVLKLVDITTGDKLSTSDVKYGLTKDGVQTIGLLSSLTDGVIDSGVIAGNNTTINYTVRLWIRDGVTDNSAISGKSLSYKLNVEVGQIMEKDPSSVEVKLFASENLGSNCATYNDGVDTFLVGQCSNNYVWYSGKLWRVVLKNNTTGAVKMVTDNAITAIPYNPSNKAAFKDSYMDQWLNQEFLPTLHDANDYLVTDYIWDATTDSRSTIVRPNGTTTVQRTVGLLNRYEYYTTYASSNGLATDSTGYLRNNVYWWLMTPYSSRTTFWYVCDSSLCTISPTDGRGARPSVNLKSTIQIDSGSGSKSDPYILKGDTQETVGGTTLLSTRYSGEYLTFNNELYRIVGTENINGEVLTKITAVDKPSSLASNTFDASTTNFANASIKSDLETYYQGLNETWKNMIQPNTTWYLGTIGSGTNYKASICATVDANTSTQNCTKITDTSKYTTASIALPRAGEMFTSQITRGTKAYFWTLTPYSTSDVRRVDIGGTLYGNSPTNGAGARPSMYLKSTIKIASGNTGNGTYEYPYSIELGA